MTEHDRQLEGYPWGPRQNQDGRGSRGCAEGARQWGDRDSNQQAQSAPNQSAQGQQGFAPGGQFDGPHGAPGGYAQGSSGQGPADPDGMASDPARAGQGGLGQGNYGSSGQGGYTAQGQFGGQNSQGTPDSLRGGQYERGKAPKGYIRSDDRLREMICERLMEVGTIDASDVEVNVVGGRVTLEGTVGNRVAKYQIEDIVESIGASDVQNNLRISRDVDASRPSSRGAADIEE